MEHQGRVYTIFFSSSLSVLNTKRQDILRAFVPVRYQIYEQRKVGGQGSGRCKMFRFYGWLTYPPRATYPLQKYGFNKALLSETIC